MNGDNKDLWNEINTLKVQVAEGFAELKTILASIPDRITLAVNKHEDNCNACKLVIEHDKRLDRLEAKHAEGEKKSTFWKDKGVSVILAVLQAITVAFLVVKLGLK